MENNDFMVTVLNYDGRGIVRVAVYTIKETRDSLREREGECEEIIMRGNIK